MTDLRITDGPITAPAPTPVADTPQAGDLVVRQRLSTRIWHWTNAITLLIMMMSGLMIFNAHPRLYWGSYGANLDHAWLEIGSRGNSGFLRIGDLTIPTTGVLGVWTDGMGHVQHWAFPGWITVPSHYSLADGRHWHLAFALILAFALLVYMTWSLINGHVRRDLVITPAEAAPRHVWDDIKQHARLQFPTGAAALKYNILQKFSYVGVIFILIPLMVGTGLTLSPGGDAAFPWLLDLFGGRQSARSLHFIGMCLLIAFFLVHITMVILAGPLNELRSITTGRYRLPGKVAAGEDKS